MNTRKVALSGLFISLYIVVMYFTQSFAFYQYQIRIATSLYALAFVFPFLAIPLGIANSLSNVLLGGLGLLDIVGGFFVGITTAYIIVLIKKYGMDYRWVFLPIIFVPSLIVPIWLSIILGIPYLTLFISITIGQLIPAITGVWLIGYLLRNNW